MVTFRKMNIDGVSAGNPKVFFKYFFVNTTTGEKSGEMLALARFAATNGQPDPENQNPGGQPEGGNQGGGEGGGGIVLHFNWKIL